MTSAIAHRICTRDEARDLVTGRERLWLSRCSLEEPEGDRPVRPESFCLGFAPGKPPGTAAVAGIAADEALEILEESRERRLVALTFRIPSAGDEVSGVCFCRGDCCAVPGEGYRMRCERGAMIERTDEGCCSSCGICEQACPFSTRVMDEGELVIVRCRCFGCGLCAEACPEGCVEMEPRT